jgi:hypothetical protein
MTPYVHNTAAKSEVVRLHSGGDNVPCFNIGNAIPVHTDSFRYLGIVFSQTLNMTSLLSTQPVLF